MKTFATFTVMSIFAIIGWCVITLPFLPNLGLKFGYWGELNRIVAKLNALGNVVVEGTRVNRDTSLEEFTVDLKVDGRTGISIYFPESHLARDRKLEEAKILHVQCNGLNPLDSINTGHWSWIFELELGNILELKHECEIRSVADILQNLQPVLGVAASIYPVEFADRSKLKWPREEIISLDVPCAYITP